MRRAVTMPGRKARHLAETWTPVTADPSQAKFDHLITVWGGEIKTIWRTGVDPLDNPDYERHWLRSIHAYE